MLEQIRAGEDLVLGKTKRFGMKLATPWVLFGWVAQFHFVVFDLIGVFFFAGYQCLSVGVDVVGQITWWRLFRVDLFAFPFVHVGTAAAVGALLLLLLVVVLWISELDAFVFLETEGVFGCGWTRGVRWGS